MELTSLLAGAHEPPEGRSTDSWAPATGTRDALAHKFCQYSSKLSQSR